MNHPGSAHSVLHTHTRYGYKAHEGKSVIKKHSHFLQVRLSQLQILCIPPFTLKQKSRAFKP